MSKSAVATARDLDRQLRSLTTQWRQLSDEQIAYLQGFIDRRENMNQVHLGEHDRRRAKILGLKDRAEVLRESLRMLGVEYRGEVLEGRELEEASAWTGGATRRAAFHEAAHAVACYLSGRRLRELYVAYMPDERGGYKFAGGECRYHGPSSMFIDLAGYAAESLAGLGRCEDEVIASDDLAHYRRDDPYYNPASRHWRLTETTERLRGCWTTVHGLAAHLGRECNWLSGPEAERVIETHMGESTVRTVRARRQVTEKAPA